MRIPSLGLFFFFYCGLALSALLFVREHGCSSLLQSKYPGSFYPTALKGCWGIVFTHGVRMGGRAGGMGGRPGGRREKVCPGCISETIRCRKLILGRDIG